MSLNVGELVGYLRLDMGDFESGMARGQALADKLDGKDVNIKATADTAGAEAKLAALAASGDKVSKSSGGASSGMASVETAARKLADASSAANVAQLRLSEVQGSGTAKASALASAHQAVTKAQRELSDIMKSSTPEVIRAADAMKPLDDGNKKVASSSKDAGKGMGLLSMAIVGLGPAIVPLAAGAAGLAVGFGAMGAAGILAIVGINQEIKAGTPLGGAYSAMLSTLKGDLTTLGHTAAAGVLGPFQKEVATLQTQMPALNSIVGEFSVITGKTAGNLMSGLVAAFIALEPLARDVGVYVLDLSGKFSTLMSGSGVTSFGDYIRSVFPQVMQAVESVVGAAIRLVAALAPLGLGTLSMLKVFADVINALPVDVLSNLATVAVSVFIGFKSYGMLSAGVTALGTALEFVGVSAETAATGLAVLNIAAGVIAAVLAVMVFAFTANANATRENQQAVNEYTDALIRSNGAIDANVRELAFKKLSDSGAIDDARALGLNLSLVTDAMLGNVPASRAVGAQMAAMTTGSHDSGAAFLTQQTHINNLASALGTSTAQFGTATQAQKDHAAATATSTAAVTPAAAAQAALAAKVGTTSAALVLAAAGQQKTADAAANATAKMYIENDAAGLLKQALDILNGKALGLMEAQTADAAATNSAAAALKANKSAIEGNSAAAIANQQALQQKAHASQAEAEAVGKATGSTNEAIKAYQGSKTALEGSLRAQGLLTPAVQAYINKLYDVKNLKLAPTKLDVTHAAADASIAVFQKRIDAIKQGKVPGIDANSAAGRAVLAALQAAIDRIKQGKPPGITTNITPGEATARALQGEIDRIKQNKQPGLAANSQAAQNTIRLLQAQIDELRGKTIAVKIQWANSAYSVSGINPATHLPVGFAGGGPIDGVGTGTSDSNLILGSKGEHMLTADDVKAAGGHAAIFAFRKSLHAYSSGGPINIDMPNPSSLGAGLDANIKGVNVAKMLPALPTGGGGGGAGGAAQWASTVLAVLAVMGQPSSLLAGVLRLINKESSGVATAINLTDSNAMAGTPSMGLIQTIMPTFLANAGPFAALGPYNPFANIYAGLNHAIGSWGSIAAVDPLVHAGGYANGTNGAAPGWGMVGEKGKELVLFNGGETVVPNSMLGGSGPGYAAGTLAPMGPIGQQYGLGMDPSASLATITATITAITALTAAWKTAIAAADAATSRAKLVNDIATAITALNAATKAKDTSAITTAKQSYTDAKTALTAFDTAAKVAAEDARIAADQAALATAKQMAANRESWAFDHESAQQQLADINARMRAEQAYSDTWMTLAKQRESLQQQIDAAAAAAVAAAQAAAQATLDAAMSKLTQMESAQDTYTSAVAAANAALAAQTQQLTDARTVALATWAQLSATTTVGFAPSMSLLIGNAKTQIKQFQTWMDALATARSRGLSEAVISSLGLDQGPQALAQLQQINKGTADQFTALNDLVAQKTTDANAEMVREKTNMLSTLGQALVAAQKVAADTILVALAAFTAQLATIGMTQGETYAAAIAKGLLSGIPAIIAAAQAVQAAMAGAASAGSTTSAPGSGYSIDPGNPNPGAGNVFYQVPSLPGAPTNPTTSAMLPPQSTPYPHGILVYTDPVRAYLGQIQTADTAANRAMIVAEGDTLVGGFAGGGLIGGPGTSTSDSITGVDASGTPVVHVSRDEFVVNAAAYAQNKGLVNAINSGQQISVAAPVVHVYVDGQEFRGMVRVEIADDDQAKAMTARRMVNA